MTPSSKNKFCLLLLGLFLSFNTFGQTVVSGVVKDAKGETLPGVNVIVIGTIVGSSTNLDGQFLFPVRSEPPFTIRFSAVGYTNQEVEITASDQKLDIVLEEQLVLTEEVVVTGSRLEESILESSVSVEKMGLLDIKSTAADNFYDGVVNMKGIDVVSSSMLFKAINVRGVGSPFQTRFVQRTDGMDMQTPTGSLTLGNMSGVHDIDVESVEMQPGAASALYGPNAFHGILNITSKSPFLYQGLSAQLKTGVNNVNSPAAGIGASPYFDAAVRYAKAVNGKFAFKINLSYLQAKDWAMGDQRLIDTNSGIRVVSENTGINGNSLDAWGNTAPIVGPDRKAVLVGGIPIYRTGYREPELTDYQARNIRASATLVYRLTDNVEVSWMTKYAEGTGVLTATSREVYRPQFFINKLEFKGNDFFLRAYHVSQKMGEGSYGIRVMGELLQSQNIDNQTWIKTYSDAFETNGNDHAAARALADAGRLTPGTPAFNTAFDKFKNTLSSEGGAAAYQTAEMSHIEGQYDFSRLLGKVIGLTSGIDYRRYEVFSNGTLFDDKDKSAPNFYHLGAYIQATKSLFAEKIKFTGSVRYDKSQYFEGQFTPKISMVFKPAPAHNFRASYQTGFKNPIFLEQAVRSVLVPGPLPFIFVGGRKGLFDPLHTGIKFDLANGVPTNERVDIPFLQPEEVRAFEVGYKGMITPKLFVDLSYNQSKYGKFVGLNFTEVVFYAPGLTTGTPDPNIQDGLYTVVQNLPTEFRIQGISLGADYIFGKGYNLSANYTWSEMMDEVPISFSFNNPEHRMNLIFGNRAVFPKWGFNLALRYQSAYGYYSVFGGATTFGEMKAFSVLDAQISYNLKKGMKIKGVASNLFNTYYTQALGSPGVGGMYSLAFVFGQ